jgi:site-specific DNA recombinase
MTKRDLEKWGVRIVQTVFDLPEGPEGDMIESILNAVDQYQIVRNGADIAYKMGSKAKKGGTISRAKLGYLNARDTSEGRNIGIVELDPERAPFIPVAFELFATGEFSLESLAEELTIRGLRTRKGKCPGGPISTSQLALLLRDPYYLGYVSYDGVLIRGWHEPLVSQELFDKVQAILDHRSGNGVRRRRHHHYLKGHLYCGECHDKGVESRMLMQWSNGRHGGRYLYFFCVRKQQHLCDSRYGQAETIEAAIEQYYATIHFPTEIADRIRSKLNDLLAEEMKASTLLAKHLKTELARLDKQEENLIDLAAEGGLAVAKVKMRLADIQHERARINERLNDGVERLAVSAHLVDQALRLLDNPQQLYLSLSPEQRRYMNDAIFEKLYVHDGEISDACLRPPFDDLIRARDEIQHYGGFSASGLDAGTKKGRPDVSRLGPLAALYFAGGSSKGLMVGAEGLEPPTCSL